MAGKLFIGKQFYIREKFEKTQVMKIVNKIFNNDSYIPVGLLKSIRKDKKKNTISICHTRCRFSGRAKANFNKFRMSRMIFKKLGENLFLNGIRKSSW
jgi:ribosomal protein S14